MLFMQVYAAHTGRGTYSVRRKGDTYALDVSHYIDVPPNCQIFTLG